MHKPTVYLCFISASAHTFILLYAHLLLHRLILHWTHRVRCYLQLKLGEGAVHDYLCASAAAFYFNVKDPGPQLSHSLSFFFLFFHFLMQFIPAHRCRYSQEYTRMHRHLHKQIERMHIDTQTPSRQTQACTDTQILAEHPICVEGLVTFLISLSVATVGYSLLA